MGTLPIILAVLTFAASAVILCISFVVVNRMSTCTNHAIRMIYVMFLVTSFIELCVIPIGWRPTLFECAYSSIAAALMLYDEHFKSIAERHCKINRPNNTGEPA